MTRRYSRDDPGEDIGEDVGVGVVECQLIQYEVLPLMRTENVQNFTRRKHEDTAA